MLGPKGWTLAGLAAAVGAAHDAGLAVRLRYVVGLPGTSASSVASSVDFALKNGVELATFAMDRPAPGSPEWKKLRWTGEQYVAACLRPDRAVHRPTGYRSLVEVEESWRKAWTAFYGSTRFWGRAARKLLGGRARSRQPRRVWKRL